LVRTKRKIRRTMIELTDKQYFFLKEKSLVLQKQNKSHSIISIIRDLIEKDHEKWMKEKKSYGA